MRHWTPRYIFNRTREIIYQKFNPDAPWLTPAANRILESYLESSDVGLEFGSGRSTIWFARHVQYLTSVEHNESWHNKINQATRKHKIENVHLIYAPKDVSDNNGQQSAYVKASEKFDANSLDFVLVDGMYRDFCTLAAMEKLQPGGVLIIDNVNWFLPSSSNSPSSRRPDQGPSGELWRKLGEHLSDWRTIWTSSGVTDTALFFKPCVR